MLLTRRVVLMLACGLFLIGCTRPPAPAPPPASASAPAPATAPVAVTYTTISVEELRYKTKLTDPAHPPDTEWKLVTGQAQLEVDDCSSTREHKLSARITEDATLHASLAGTPHWRSATNVTCNGRPYILKAHVEDGHALTGFDMQPGPILLAVFERRKSGWAFYGCRPFNCQEDACAHPCTLAVAGLDPTPGEHAKNETQPHWFALGLSTCTLAVPDDSGSDHVARSTSWAFGTLPGIPLPPPDQPWDFAVIELLEAGPTLRYVGVMKDNGPGDGWAPLAPTGRSPRWVVIPRECTGVPVHLDKTEDGTLRGFSLEAAPAPATP